jgi:hypothetical protein
VADQQIRTSKLNTGDQTIARLQSLIDRALQQIVNLNPFFRGSLLEVSLTTADLPVDHLLNREYRGFLVVRLRGDARIWESSTPNAAPSQKIILKASGAVDATVWVF